MASIYLKNEAFDDAIRLLNELKGIVDEDAFVYYNLGVALYCIQDYPRALSNLNAAYMKSKDPDFTADVKELIEAVKRDINL